MALRLIACIICCMFSFLSFSQENFSASWKKIEEFENKGLVASAKNEVINILREATRTSNGAQQIKAALFYAKYTRETDQDEYAKNYFFLDSLIKKTSVPARNILYSIQASFLWTYQQNNNWRFSNRTTLTNDSSRDINTWSLKKLQETVTFLYKKSTSDETILKSTSIGDFQAIIHKGKNTSLLRPTLFDFIAFRALEYFSSENNSVTEPAYKFIINDENYFSPAANFINLRFQTKDTASLFRNALRLYQQILQFHLQDKDPSALIDADLLRLNFVYEHGVFTHKKDLYERALRQLQNRFATHPGTAEVMFARTSLVNMNQERNFRDSSKIKAKEIADSIIALFPTTNAAAKSKILIWEITEPSLSIQTENVYLPAQPFKLLSKYKSVDKLFIKIFKLTPDEIKKNDRTIEEEQKWNEILRRNVVREFSINLPVLKDFNEHTAEIKVDALDPGAYYIVTGNKNNFTSDAQIITRNVIYVSNISLIGDYSGAMFVVHRNTGAPLFNATVTSYIKKYEYSIGSYSYVTDRTYQTDKNGRFNISKEKDNRSGGLCFRIKWNNDEVFIDQNEYQIPDNVSVEKSKPETFLFTDRAIYRPGQSIFFKGIVYQRDTAYTNSRTISDYNTTLQVFNANQQKIASLKLTTNQFGSYSGRFVLPEGQMNGQFFIKDSITNQLRFIKVEEYKRPKFFVEIKAPENNYQLNDTVTVTGNVKAYAGNNIDGAKVSYRVIRKTNYPMFSGYRIWWPSPNNEQEITNGITETAKDGSFKIIFKLLPDEESDKNNLPVYNYEINADVTDVNGETRSQTKNIAAAWHNLQLNILQPETILADSFKTIQIQSTNINDVFTPALVTLTIEKLQEPSVMYKTRYWQTPDQFTMTKTEHDTLFPNDPYKDEDKKENWPVAAKEFEKTDSNTILYRWNIGKKLQAGWYKITATSKDKNGVRVTNIKYVQVTDLVVNTTKEPLQITANKRNAKPGDKISVNISTAFDKIWFIERMQRLNSNHTYLKNISRSNVYAININEKDLGGIDYAYLFVKNNRVYSGNLNIAVPFNKELNISYETFRDKLTPGSNETWKLKIIGKNAEKISAEMLINMYDASLDQFVKHEWNAMADLWPSVSKYNIWFTPDFTLNESNNKLHFDYKEIVVTEKIYPYLLFFESYINRTLFTGTNVMYRTSVQASEMAPISEKEGDAQSYKSKISNKIVNEVEKEESITKNNNNNIQIRKNFNETAFFNPQLQTDSSGNISFSFTIPEALTQWKLMALAHTKDLASAYDEKTIITQKELMVQPNMPRFIRQGDKAELPVKIVNITDKEITGTVQLELFDAATNKPIDGWMKNIFPVQYFTADAKGSMSVVFPVEIPIGFTSVLGYRIKAITNDKQFSDGEENAIPVLSNRLLVTESMPLNLRNTNQKNFRFEKLLNSGNSGTLTNQLLTIEYTSNPLWLVVQALPYLNNPKNESADDYFYMIYANTLASHILKNAPAIKNVFDKWRITDTTALISNLSKNQELKSVLLEETPWVFDAENETQQKKNIILLFDLIQISRQNGEAISKLKELQLPNGAFPWFKGGIDDRYITQSILTGFGRLKHLNALPVTGEMQSMISAAIQYLDKKIKQDYDNLKKAKVKLSQNNLSQTAVQYLYMRSFFDVKIPSETKTAFDYYTQQSQKYWLSQNKMMQAMIAVVANRKSTVTIAKSIIRSLKQYAIVNEELGMYYKEFANSGYYWYQSPVESQAMIIEAFEEVDKNPTTLNDLRTWLIKQKQTQNWKSNKATADATYAILISNGKQNDELNQQPKIKIQLGNQIISNNDQAEVGTGYFKQNITGDKIIPAMGNIQVTSDRAATGMPSWGAVYWQYFEDIDKITSAVTPLQLIKKIFIEKNTDYGPVLTEVKEGDEMQIGDKIKIRIELRVDRNMEYLHMKDMRSAATEPVNVISGYKFQDGLSYYETTKDASTNFFFNWLPRGIYVFEYPSFITQAGNYSNGITTIQCLYAPEFISHSNGARIIVAAKK